MPFTVVDTLPAHAAAKLEKLNKVRAGEYAKVTSHVTVFTLDEFVGQSDIFWSAGRWYDNESISDVRRLAVEGKPSLVKKSDELLAKIENVLDPVAPRSVMVDDVVGAVPNIPALLAGQPLSMRRRARLETNDAPVRVIVDLVSSGGSEPAALLTKGIACLALVRALSARRPVELWVATSGGGYGIDTTGNKAALVGCMFRVDTSPLDLVRAAWIMTSQGLCRGVGYETMHKAPNDAYAGMWAFNSIEANRALGGDVLARAIGAGEGDDLIYVPGLYLRDEVIADPAKWVKRHVDQLVNLRDREIALHDWEIKARAAS